MTNYYIDNDRFESLIEDWTSGQRDQEEELFNMFDLLISKIISSFKFKIDEDDAKQDCFVLLLKTLPNFKKPKGKAFNYFTTVIINNLKLVYTKSKKYDLKIQQYIDSMSDPNDLLTN